ncbi:hypothetical protein QCA50_020644 [Cerrena zonata]|uniref:Uncharacterized protein n=1 Tax=Cerrena zonata TaxID=2478898 RepID=A0AAW0FGJ9_9APHY
MVWPRPGPPRMFSNLAVSRCFSALPFIRFNSDGRINELTTLLRLRCVDCDMKAGSFFPARRSYSYAPGRRLKTNEQIGGYGSEDVNIKILRGILASSMSASVQTIQHLKLYPISQLGYMRQTATNNYMWGVHATHTYNKEATNFIEIDWTCKVTALLWLLSLAPWL